MDKETFAELLGSGAAEVGVLLSGRQVEAFWTYLEELLQWNRRFKLTAITAPEQIVIKHFVDSLTPLPYIPPAGKILDIGPGAGFPGLPLKIAAPGLDLTLVDANRKAVSFCLYLSRLLQLEPVKAYHGRIEIIDLGSQTFDLAISRALAPPAVVVDLAMPLVQAGGLLVQMLGPMAAEDFSGLVARGKNKGLELQRRVDLFLPRGHGSRTLLLWRKE